MCETCERERAAAAELVSAGIVYLDQNFPGWRDKIDVDELEIHSSKNCILGQLFADRTNNLEFLDEVNDCFDSGWTYWLWEWGSWDMARALGFVDSTHETGNADVYVSSNLLTEAWKAALSA